MKHSGHFQYTENLVSTSKADWEVAARNLEQHKGFLQLLSDPSSQTSKLDKYVTKAVSFGLGCEQ